MFPVAMMLVLLILSLFLCIPVSSFAARTKTKHKP
jgi:competence protein ComGC